MYQMSDVCPGDVIARAFDASWSALHNPKSHSHALIVSSIRYVNHDADFYGWNTVLLINGALFSNVLLDDFDEGKTWWHTDKTIRPHLTTRIDVW